MWPFKPEPEKAKAEYSCTDAENLELIQIQDSLEAAERIWRDAGALVSYLFNGDPIAKVRPGPMEFRNRFMMRASTIISEHVLPEFRNRRGVVSTELRHGRYTIIWRES